MNTLVLRTDLSGNPTFRELIARVREVTLGAYAHQDLPFEKLRVEFNPIKDEATVLLFQVMFVLQNVPSSDLELDALAVERLSIDHGITNFDLTLSLEKDEKMACVGRCITTRTCTSPKQSRDYEANFPGFAGRDCGRSRNNGIGELPLLWTDTERCLLLEGWNRTSTDNLRRACLAAMFEAQVGQTPDAGSDDDWDRSGNLCGTPTHKPTA